jgi:hypothetical protein
MAVRFARMKARMEVHFPPVGERLGYVGSMGKDGKRFSAQNPGICAYGSAFCAYSSAFCAYPQRPPSTKFALKSCKNFDKLRYMKTEPI